MYVCALWRFGHFLLFAVVVLCFDVIVVVLFAVVILGLVYAICWSPGIVLISLLSYFVPELNIVIDCLCFTDPY